MKTELVTTLKRQATKILAELHDSKEPVLITEHGQPSAYLIDVSDYDLMQMLGDNYIYQSATITSSPEYGQHR